MKSDWNLLYIAEHAEEIWMSIRWPQGLCCIDCASVNIVKLRDGRYKCKDCGKVFSNKSGTLLHGSKISIKYWMIALYLMLSGKGISSYELHRKLQITQKTAYYMLMRLRISMSQDNTYIDSAVVAHDEVYIGGDYRNFCLSKRQALIKKFKLPKKAQTVAEKIAIGNAVNKRTKKACFGITDGDKCVLIQVPTPIKQEYILDVYTKHVSSNSLAVSDCSALYNNWQALTGRELHTNNHSKRQFKADNGTSSNMIESVFSWLERTNMFVQIHYRRAYTQLYLDEFAFRYNTRKMSVKDKMIEAIFRCTQEQNRDVLKELNDKEDELYKDNEWFDPEVFFRENPFVLSIKDDGLVYRREDYV